MRYGRGPEPLYTRVRSRHFINVRYIRILFSSIYECGVALAVILLFSVVSTGKLSPLNIILPESSTNWALSRYLEVNKNHYQHFLLYNYCCIIIIEW